MFLPTDAEGPLSISTGPRLAGDAAGEFGTPRPGMSWDALRFRMSARRQRGLEPDWRRRPRRVQPMAGVTASASAGGRQFPELVMRIDQTVTFFFLFFCFGLCLESDSFLLLFFFCSDPEALQRLRVPRPSEAQFPREVSPAF